MEIDRSRRNWFLFLFHLTGLRLSISLHSVLLLTTWECLRARGSRMPLCACLCAAENKGSGAVTRRSGGGAGWKLKIKSCQSRWAHLDTRELEHPRQSSHMWSFCTQLCLFQSACIPCRRPSVPHCSDGPRSGSRQTHVVGSQVYCSTWLQVGVI